MVYMDIDDICCFYFKLRGGSERIYISPYHHHFSEVQISFNTLFSIFVDYNVFLMYLRMASFDVLTDLVDGG